ncbi:uncharacterized protein DUF4845 [Sphaerotilus hippei]|uniref:Uncharacterized protein DUF4845 n=1 Tax=Sphaerotilus hippei TaxID=744406 RepID=A0A318H1M7_9BURK|nr:DUF4845 domain-containing protein [Sphaerotilus hippei]PXW97035.1 uncharacterized protein DUF4845 [Sphaerotilus hippei]
MSTNELRPATRAWPRQQRGITLIGLIFWATLITFVAIVALRVVPTVNEYYTIARTVDKVAREGGGTVPEIRIAFDRYRQIEYGITSLTGRDLDITKENDRIVVSFAYSKEIELFGPVHLLIKYQGRSH